MWTHSLTFSRPRFGITQNSRLLARAAEIAVPLLGLVGGLCFLAAMRTPEPSAGRTPTAAMLPARATPRLARGTLVGVVEDRWGAPLPGARVELLDEDGVTVLDVRASRASADGLSLGEFRIDEVPEGHYTIVAEADGMKSHAIRVPVSAWAETRVRMHVGADPSGT